MINQLTDSIYVLSHDDDQERPTLGVVSGDRYSLVVDAGNSPRHAQEFLQEIKKLNLPPIRYMVITHAHWDHFLGMNEFDAVVIVNSRTNEKLKKWTSFQFDDDSLQHYVETQQIDSMFMKSIQANMTNRERFKLNSPDLIFEQSLTIDLGNQICIIERIQSTHTDDSTIVYVPDEKVVFLGDAAYCKTTDSLYHFQQNLLLPMIEDIQKYDAELSVLGHESICDANEMDMYWRDLIRTSRATTSPSLEQAIENFKAENKRTPDEDELFFLKGFVNDQIVQSQSPK